MNVAVAPGRLASRISPLLREAAFRRYWGAQSISLVGDQITSIGLPLAAVLALHASPAEMGYLSALVWLPSPIREGGLPGAERVSDPMVCGRPGQRTTPWIPSARVS